MIVLSATPSPTSATGGLAAEGVINQLGRPDIEPLEVLVREAVQNCWDAVRDVRARHSRRDRPTGARRGDGRAWSGSEAPRRPAARTCRSPRSCAPASRSCTSRTSAPAASGARPAPTSVAGRLRDFVDFVRNIGQPPDKDFGGGSFGYGKAAFYIASRARTILVDTLCETPTDGLERRLIGCGARRQLHQDGRPYTGRHWWGRMVDGVPEPLIGEEAAGRRPTPRPAGEAGREGLGTTVAIDRAGCRSGAPTGAIRPSTSSPTLSSGTSGRG